MRSPWYIEGDRMNIVKDKVAEIKGIPTREALMEQLENETYYDLHTKGRYKAKSNQIRSNESKGCSNSIG